MLVASAAALWYGMARPVVYSLRRTIDGVPFSPWAMVCCEPVPELVPLFSVT